MTTLVETVQAPTTITKSKNAKSARKAPVRRDFNSLGKFFAKVRIDLDMTTSDWAKALGVSSLSVTNLERSDAKLTFDYAIKVSKLIQEKAPHYEDEFASIVAKELGVLVIPTHSSNEDISYAYNILMKGLPKVESAVGHAPTE